MVGTSGTVTCRLHASINPEDPEVNGDRRHRRSQAERSATTQAALLVSARELFAERGFAGAGREEIVRRAGVTRGALYHHFAGKEDLFRAVFEEVEREVTERVAKAAVSTSDPLAALRRGCQEFLDAALDPAVQRIVLVDAPAVLGWSTWRELEARYGLGLTTMGLQAAMDADAIERQPLEPLAHMLLASLNEAALLVAGADDPNATRAEVGQVVDHLLDRLSGHAPDPTE
ncbi:MAG: TetR/AcrR family transcriptional regulator [Acidimicrobiia bacterium]